MLYERWRAVAHERRNEMALRDLPAGRTWTFNELAAETERAPVNDQRLLCPAGTSAGFVLDVLRGWRDGRVICPLDEGQSLPRLNSFPAGCAHLKLTSATTATERLIAFTAEQLAADVDNIVATMGLRPDSPNLGVISLAHSYGFSNLVLPLLLHGIPLILAGSSLPETIRQATSGVRNITLPAVPALWRAWHEADVLGDGIRLAISAGAPLPLLLEAGVFQRCGLKIHNFYGSSECGGIAYDQSDRPRTDATLAGRPMNNVLVNSSSDGCLEVRGAAVASTYWPEPSQQLAEGYFCTSDLVELRDGQIFILGRASDQINVAGRKVYPETIERVLMEHHGLQDCLVFGVPDDEAGRGELIVAAIVADARVEEEELKRALSERLPSWQLPRRWWRVENLGVNRRGKVSRIAMRQRYLNRWDT